MTAEIHGEDSHSRPLDGNDHDPMSEYLVGEASMSEVLSRIRRLALSAAPSAELVGVVMIGQRARGGYTFTHAEIPELDRLQFSNGEGPSLDAFRDGRVYEITSTRTDTRWPRFCRAARRQGVLSAVSLPMVSHHVPVGAINIYSRHERAFTPDVIETTRRFAGRAAFVVANAHAYWDVRVEADTLSIAIESRAIIEQAKGVIMGTQGVSADIAFRTLVEQSQHENIKLHTIAEQVVKNSLRHR